VTSCDQLSHYVRAIGTEKVLAAFNIVATETLLKAISYQAKPTLRKIA
jgi:hypothetical protein